MPWIILMTDRRALGSPICALSRVKRGSGRRTHTLHRAMLFPTERKARAHLKKVVARLPVYFYSIAEVEAPEPRDAHEARHQADEGVRSCSG